MSEDDIFNVDDGAGKSFLDSLDKEVESKVNIVNPPSTNSEIVKDNIDNVIGKINEDFPKLIGESYPKDYMDMYERIIYQYTKLPKINYDAIYKELSGLTIKSCPTPTLQVINQELQRVQAAKERLSEIMTDILQAYTLKKRAVDILSESWCYFTTAKSADARKGDAVFRLSDFDMDFAKTDALLKTTSHIAKNLDNFQENLSRRITIFQLQLKLHDMGRGALPDFNFKDDVDSEFGLKKSNSSNEGSDAEPFNF